MPRTVLSVAVAAVAFLCLSLSVATESDLGKHLDSVAVLLVLGAIGGLIAWRNARASAGRPARSWLEDARELGQRFRALAIPAALALVVGVLLHPLVAAPDNVPSLALAALTMFLAGVSAEIGDASARPAAWLLRPALVVAVVFGTLGAWSLFLRVIAWGREAGLVAFALLIIALLVMERRDRHRAAARASAASAVQRVEGGPSGH